MKVLWQSFLESVWPSRYGESNDKSYRLVLLQSIVAFGIAIAAGPEVILAAEMTMVLELLGVTLFLMAYASALMLLATRVAHAVRSLVLPDAHAPFIHSSAPLQVRASAWVHIGIHVIGGVAMAAGFGAWVRIAVNAVA